MTARRMLGRGGCLGTIVAGVVAHGGGGAYNPQDIGERLAMEDAMCETVC